MVIIDKIDQRQLSLSLIFGSFQFDTVSLQLPMLKASVCYLTSVMYL